MVVAETVGGWIFWMVDRQRLWLLPKGQEGTFQGEEDDTGGLQAAPGLPLSGSPTHFPLDKLPVPGVLRAPGLKLPFPLHPHLRRPGLSWRGHHRRVGASVRC